MALPLAAPRSTASLHHDWTEVEDIWRALENRAVGTGYQGYDWVNAWFRHCTPASGRKAVVAVFSEWGHPFALLPLEVAEMGLARIGRGPGGRHANFKGLLIERDALAADVPWRELLVAAGRQAGLDGILLANQPRDIDGRYHPLAALPESRPGLAYAARLDLPSDPEEALGRVRSKSSIKSLAKKQRQLSALGPVTFRIASDDADVTAMLDMFFREKAERLASLGLSDPFADPAIRAFFRQACDLASPALELHGLWVGDRLIAMFAGARLGGRLSGAVNAHDLSPELAKYSPGEQLLAEVVRDAARRGFSVLDLGVGRGSLKDRFCEREEPLFDTALPVTPLGRAALMMLSAGDWMKATLQRDERLARPARKLAGWLGLD